MSQSLFGVETEYACVPVVVAEDDATDSFVTVPDQMMDVARHTLVHLPDRRSPGVFLGNGARFYVDCGSHPEYATPECDNPWDVVRHVLAGDRIMATLASGVATVDGAPGDVSMFKHNVDLSGSGATWGCHESYLHRVAPEALAPKLIPHLVSRVIYTGAGGFHPLSPGLEFSVSPRVAHINRTTSSDSTSNRGIFHTKNEPLGKGYHRLHVLCGESLCSHRANWLKVGTTALIVALADADLPPSKRVAPRTPLRAFRTFAADPTCSAEVPLVDGTAATAVEIQRRYLTLAEEHLDHSFMPGWAPEVCREWRAMLARLANAPSSVDRTLDWAIKWSLYDARIRRRSFTWERVNLWQPFVTRLRLARDQAGIEAQEVPAEVLLDPDGPMPHEIRRLSTAARERGLEWSELTELAALRHELFEVETRFSELDTRGIFGALDRAGVLDHRIDGVDAIDEATRQPPKRGRAHTRGAAVQRLSGSEGWSCDWSGVWNHRREVRALDLSDPFAQRNVRELDPRPTQPDATPAKRRRRASIGEGRELTAFMEYLLRRE